MLLFYKIVYKVKFIYDQHDLSPELFAEKFPERRKGMFIRLIMLFERLTFAVADVVISTNESLKKVALERGKKHGSSVFVVRNGPESADRRSKMAYSKPDGFSYICSYVGVMGAQDGVDLILRAAKIILQTYQRKDILFLLIGAGEQFDQLRALSLSLNVDGIVRFTGRVPDEDLDSILDSSDVCLAPDPENNFNNWHTMNKIMDYMSFGKPIVSFSLCETKVSAGDSAVYIKNNDVRAFAEAILKLVDDPVERGRLGRIGRERVKGLTWEHSVAHLKMAYESLVCGSLG